MCESAHPRLCKVLITTDLRSSLMSRPEKVYHKTYTFMQSKLYQTTHLAQIKMLREYFSVAPVENMKRRYGIGFLPSQI